jgi:hypothetical protein
MERKSLSGVCDADPPGNSGYSVARQLPLMAAPGVLLVPHRARVQALTGHAFPVFHLPFEDFEPQPPPHQTPQQVLASECRGFTGAFGPPSPP